MNLFVNELAEQLPCALKCTTQSSAVDLLENVCVCVCVYVNVWETGEFIYRQHCVCSCAPRMTVAVCTYCEYRTMSRAKLENYSTVRRGFG
jgi:hypothetical protein